MHNLNVIARFVVYLIWAWIFYFDGLHLSMPMRSLVNFIVIADIATWLIYQVYLLPRMVIHFGIGTVTNLIVIFFLLRGLKTILPQAPDMQAMAVMVFLAFAGVKGMYYFMLEMSPAGSRQE